MLEKRFILVVLATLGVAVLAAQVAVAQTAGPMIPDSISFQGSVQDTAGNPINTTVAMEFRLYNNSGGLLWTETQSSVQITEGIFNTVLGRSTGLDYLAFDEPFELEVKIDGQKVSQDPLSSAPYALAVRGFYAFPRISFTDTSMNVVAGARNNVVGPAAVGATVGGGGGYVSGTPKPNKANGKWATISGGFDNTADGRVASIGGGFGNVALGQSAVVAGGQNNSATGDFTIVGGGGDNKATALNASVVGGSGNQATGRSAFIGGGFNNMASGKLSVIPGGANNAAKGEQSFAAGAGAKANHDYSFVWAGQQFVVFDDSFATTGVNQFLVRASGGIGFGTNKPGAALHVKQIGSWIGGGLRLEDTGTDTTRWDVFVDAANDLDFAYTDTIKSFIYNFDGSFNQLSDARLKKDVRDVGPVLGNVLSLRPRTYRYLDNPADSPPSMGFIAQDVEREFPEIVREKNGMKALAYSDFAVLAIKAIQEQQVLIEELQREVALLKNRP